MHTNRRTDSFQIFYGPSYCLLIFYENFQQFVFSSLVNATEMMTGFPFSGCKKAYSKCSGNFFRIKPFELLFMFAASSSSLLDFSVLFSSTLSTVFLNLTLSQEIPLQDVQDTGNSSHSHSLNSKKYNHYSVQNLWELFFLKSHNQYYLIQAVSNCD